MQKLIITVPSNVGKSMDMEQFSSMLWKAYAPLVENVITQGARYLRDYIPKLPTFYRLKPIPAVLR